MIVVLDNYDSFVFNIARYVEELGYPADVVRSDAVTVEALRSGADAVIISPGPCTPAEAGVSTDTVRELSGSVPILGICLGHQCIGAAFGLSVGRAGLPMHGRASTIRHDGTGLFAGLPQDFRAGRYHSLAVSGADTPEIAACAWSAEGEIMALRHARHPTFGLQFHPESVLTEHGYALMRAFLAYAGSGEQQSVAISASSAPA